MHTRISITSNKMAMENKKRKSPKIGRPAKEKVKLSTSINLKLTESDFKTVKERSWV